MTGAIGPYQILEPLGAGGMGEVYRAHDPRLNRDVALKVLLPQLAADPDRMARFHREAQVLASLNHPNIAVLYGIEDRALVMELVEGPTLAARIAAGPVPLEDALPIARQIADALEYAHEKGIIHRDLKPANVKLTPENNVKLLDFGLAKALDDDYTAHDSSNSPTLSLAATRVGVILGTAAYMSPEQAKGKPVDRRADIWSFGVVLAELLIGRQMYSGENAAEILAWVIRDQPRLDGLPSETPLAIRTLLGRCLDKDPRSRLRDIGEARIAIDQAIAGQSVDPAPALP
ncbi:MAG: serine/threonine-protein kinase, partial [Bryobacteraceae bacterium]